MVRAGLEPVERGRVRLCTSERKRVVLMEHRGVEYAVVQAISKQWRWSVPRDSGNDKVGFCTNRETALARAKGVIDRIVGGRNSIDEIMASNDKVR